MKCCFCGPVKNCGPFLDKIFQNIENLGTLFDDYKIIIYYEGPNSRGGGTGALQGDEEGGGQASRVCGRSH